MVIVLTIILTVVYLTVGTLIAALALNTLNNNSQLIDEYEEHPLFVKLITVIACIFFWAIIVPIGWIRILINRIIHFFKR